MKVQNSLKQKRIVLLMLVLFIFAIYVVFSYFGNRINPQNTTALALSYEYGLVPRGFVGTMLRVINNIFSINLLTYQGAFNFTIFTTVVYFVLLFVLYGICLYKTENVKFEMVETLIIFTSIYMFPEYLTSHNFGRLDEHLMIVTLICIILILLEKWEYLIIPLCGIAALIHVGFVFTNVGVILVALLWKAFQKNGRDRAKYIFIFSASFLLVSVLFLYFEIFQQPFNQNAYEEIVTLAKGMSYNGKEISDSLLDSEILKLDVFGDEWEWHIRNFVETPIYLLLYAPLIYVISYFFRGIWKQSETLIERLKYLMILTGVCTIIPSLILKIDYGRWFFSIYAYYTLITLVLIVLGDEKFIAQCQNTRLWLKEKRFSSSLFFVYFLLFMPFRDVRISDITANVTEFFASIVGLW